MVKIILATVAIVGTAGLFAFLIWLRFKDEKNKNKGENENENLKNDREIF